MLTLEYAKNPVFLTESTNAVLLTVKWAEFNEEHPFGATNYDPMPYGVDLHQRALAGEFGPIAPYVAIPIVAAGENQPTTTGSQTL